MSKNIHKIISKHMDKYTVYRVWDWDGVDTMIYYYYRNAELITKVEYNIYLPYLQALKKHAREYS